MMTIIKVRYVCGHEVDFGREPNGEVGPSTLREQRLATDKEKCPACRHATVKLQLVSSRRFRNWK